MRVSVIQKSEFILFFNLILFNFWVLHRILQIWKDKIFSKTSINLLHTFTPHIVSFVFSFLILLALTNNLKSSHQPYSFKHIVRHLKIERSVLRWITCDRKRSIRPVLILYFYRTSSCHYIQFPWRLRCLDNSCHYLLNNLNPQLSS